MRCVPPETSAIDALQPQEVGDLILEDELGGLLVAEALADAEEQPLAHLLADASALGPLPCSPCAWISNSSSSSASAIDRVRPDVR